jgi:HSP20 family protein
LPIITNEKSMADSVSCSCYDAYNVALFVFYSGMARANPNDRKIIKERRLIMTLIRYQSPELSPWSAADRLSNLRDELNSFFELPFSSSLARAGQLFSGWSPALDLYEGNDNVTAIVELPGMRKEEIEISLHDGTLTVSGERKRESSSNGDKAERTERYVGTFRRSIALPTRVDANKVSATYRDGILTVTLPKAEEVKPKQIQVN